MRGLFRVLLALLGAGPRRSRRRAAERRTTFETAAEVERIRPHPEAAPVLAADRTERPVLRGRCWVIDGDTIVIDKVHIRLAGIDAPELDQPYGQMAKRALMALCKGQVITAVADGSLSHDRTVAVCRLEDGRDLSAEMVRAGLALDWKKHSGGQYRHLEAEGLRRKLWRVDARQKGRMPPADARVPAPCPD